MLICNTIVTRQSRLLSTVNGHGPITNYNMFTYDSNFLVTGERSVGVLT